MKNLLILKVIFLIFFITFTSQAIAADRILPIPKPIVDQETKIITAKKKEIYPQKKPETKKVTPEETQEKITAIQQTDEEIFIYPEKKPLTFKKTVDKAKALFLLRKVVIIGPLYIVVYSLLVFYYML